jgi:hypothetical protein
MRATALSLCTLSPALALVAGLPEWVRPGAPPTVWASWSNDTFGGELGRNTDDFRTNALAAGFSYDHRWVIAIDNAMLTTRQSAELRTDQITLTAGHVARFQDAGLAGAQARLDAGVGLRRTGSYGGQDVQNRWHDFLGYRRIELPEDTEEDEGMAWARASWLVTDQEPRTLLEMPYLRAGQLGLELNAGGFATTGGDVQGTVGARLLLIGMDGHIGLGVEQRLMNDGQPNTVTNLVAEHEEGTWATWSASAGGWFVSGGIGTAHGGSYGTVGWQSGRTPGREASAERTSVDGMFGVFQGYSLGVQFRWRPEWLAELEPAGRLNLLFDYRFGRYPGQDWYADTVITRQPTLGIDCAAWKPAAEGFDCVPFAYVALGARQEAVTPQFDDARFPEQSAWRGVTTAGIGLRLQFPRWDNDPMTPQYGLSLGYDWWLPWSTATAENPVNGDQDTYQQAGGALALRLGAAIAW